MAAMFSVALLLPFLNFLAHLIASKAAKWKFLILGVVALGFELAAIYGILAATQKNVKGETDLGFGVVILMWLAIVIFLAAVGVASIYSPIIVRALRFRRAETILPQIAYKKAFLELGNTDVHFRGVVGIDYQSADKAKKHSPGFHGYSSIEDALTHAQYGNVLLEVIFSGEITKKAKGYIATEQRVLQVIPYHCAFCDQNPSYYSNLNDKLQFICDSHGKAAIAWSKLPDKQIGKLPYNAFPLAKLSEELPWLKEEGILVAELSGDNKFVPTVIPEEQIK